MPPSSQVEADLEGGDSGFRLFSNGDVLLQVGFRAVGLYIYIYYRIINHRVIGL